MSEVKQLYRCLSGRKLFGVCAGLSEYSNQDVNLIRIIAVMLLLFPPTSFPVLVGYFAMVMVVPVKPCTAFA